MRLRVLLLGSAAGALAGMLTLLLMRRSDSGSATARATPVNSTVNSAARPLVARTDRASNRPAPAALPPAPIVFAEVTEQAQIVFQHTSGMSPQRYQPEADGSGVAVLDYDRDGWPDLYFATCVPLPLEPARSAPHHVLYRSRGDGTFDDVTAATGTGLCSFGQGLTAGDYDNDGFPDLYLTNYGPNILFHNNGDGTFAPVHGEATSAPERWGAGCALLDCDEDGQLDLYVANYAKWTVQTHPFCGYQRRGVRTYCFPGAFEPDSHVLWRNRGDGTFDDRTRQAGIFREDGRGFGVVSMDLNDDGHIDLYVANDMTGNFLFLGKGDGTFDDFSGTSGAALSGDGQARASMGVDAEDLDGDLLPELFVTNFWLEPNTLYSNLGSGQFIDSSDPSGLGSASRLAMGWGTGLVDLDNDGWPDVLVCNGHIDNNLSQREMDVPYAQQTQLWRNLTGLRFELIAGAGAYFSEQLVGRALAFGDLDNDGRLDFAANNLDGPARLLRNVPKDAHHWVRFELVGTSANRDAIGTIVDIEAAGLRLRRQLKGGASYLSAHDQRLLVGLAAAPRVDRVTFRWPSGGLTVLEDLQPDRTYTVREPPLPAR
jgi:hypothetical protein